MRRLVLSVVAVAVVAVAALVWWPAYEIDAEMARLCKADGGVHVYEPVPLPSDQLNKFGMPTFYVSEPGVKREDSLGPNYEWKMGHKELRKVGNVSLEVSTHQIIRRKDNKLLGESFQYFSFGGWQLGEGARKTCPDLHAPYRPDLIQSIFIKIS